MREFVIANAEALVARFRELAEPIDGPYIKRMRALADELDVYLILGFLEADGERTFNTAALLSPDGELIGKYRSLELVLQMGEYEAGHDTEADAALTAMPQLHALLRQNLDDRPSFEHSLNELYRAVGCSGLDRPQLVASD